MFFVWVSDFVFGRTASSSLKTTLSEVVGVSPPLPASLLEQLEPPTSPFLPLHSSFRPWCTARRGTIQIPTNMLKFSSTREA